MYLHHTVFFFFFFNDTATTEIYTLSLHDALPICRDAHARTGGAVTRVEQHPLAGFRVLHVDPTRVRELAFPRVVDRDGRSEEHTSELQSRSDLVCRLLLEKKKKNHMSVAGMRPFS